MGNCTVRHIAADRKCMEMRVIEESKESRPEKEWGRRTGRMPIVTDSVWRTYWTCLIAD